MVSHVVPLDDALSLVLGLETVARVSTRPTPVRAVQANMDKKRPRLMLQNTVPLGVSVKKDKAEMLALLEENEPCIMAMKIGPDLSKWAMIAWVPDSVPDQRKKVYQKYATQLADEMKPKVIKKLTSSRKDEVQDFLANVEQDLNSVTGTFVRTNTVFTDMGQTMSQGMSQTMSQTGPQDGPLAGLSEGQNSNFHSPGEGADDLRTEMTALRTGLAAVKLECQELRRRLDVGGILPTEDANDVNAIRNALGNPTDDIQQRMSKAEKLQDELRGRMDADMKMIAGLKGDFDGLVAILDEELQALQEKTEKGRSSDFIPRVSQAVRKSAAAQNALSPMMQQEIDELKERMDDADKVRKTMEETNFAELRVLVDEDSATLKTLKGDFDGLVAILDEELTALNEKTQDKSRSSDFIPRISQAVRKSHMASMEPITILRQEVEQLKERMEEADKLR